MVEAYLFFFEQLKQFFLGAYGEAPLGAEHPVSTRVDECFQTLRNALMVVIIDLHKDDDPQVIFETLNARGEPLLPADLLRNYIFFRVNRDDLDIEATYKKYWARFDDEFWREEVKQGRLTRPRSDSGLWPDDAAFREAWLHKPLYGPLNSTKLVHLYGRLNQTFMSSKAENLAFKQQPTVEHIMPQIWESNWPLPDGSQGLDMLELSEATHTDLRAIATRRRNRDVQTLGNMTILSSEMAKHSLLPINQGLLATLVWTEAEILKRSEELFNRALKIWER
jgi:Protein of unknown function (DUF1524)/Protein of unknown function DUF262